MAFDLREKKNTFFAAVKTAVARHRNSKKRKANKEPLLNNLRRDPFEEPFRSRVLDEPERAAETLEPYSILNLTVVSAQSLLACDIDGRSDPFVEVYLNDVLQGKSERKMFTLSPKWNFNIKLEIYSPLSIVHIRVMDHDAITQSDLIGFSEFRVADLPLDTAVRGWLELRRKRHLHGLAFSRVNRHMTRRDDDPTRIWRNALTASASAVVSPGSTPTKGLRRCKTALGLCVGKQPAQRDDDSSDECSDQGRSLCGHMAATPSLKHSTRRRNVETLVDQAKSVFNGQADRANAGEVKVIIFLQTPGDKDDEFYAHCFPTPALTVYPCGHLDLQELYADLTNIKEIMLLSFQNVLCVGRYVLSWQSHLLSASLLVWFWSACALPGIVLPTAPLLVALFLHLLRKPLWRSAMLVHEQTAPLNDEGFATIAALGSTIRMRVWLLRVIAEMGRAVSDERRFRQHAGVVFREGKPDLDFQSLVRNLSKKSWIYSPSGHRKCSKGHSLIFLGSASHHREWVCQNPRGCHCTNNERSQWQSMTMYHCTECNIHLCEPCVAQMSKPPLWTRMPTALLPDQMHSALLNIEEPLSQFRQALQAAVHATVLPLEECEAGCEAARLVSQGCVLTSALLAVLSWLLFGPFRSFMRVFFVVSELILVGLLFMSGLQWFRRMRTATHASALTARYKASRDKGPFWRRCAFFTPERPGSDNL